MKEGSLSRAMNFNKKKSIAEGSFDELKDAIKNNHLENVREIMEKLESKLEAGELAMNIIEAIKILPQPPHRTSPEKKNFSENVWELWSILLFTLDAINGFLTLDEETRLNLTSLALEYNCVEIKNLCYDYRFWGIVPHF